ncbi:DUF2690 domain-containing protein [Paractinoplanes maris]|uniref:DUF2690 domain-containing protein n=1 Tax=Paractinoplanes maris TaxID=1734446 RepID=UPI0020205DC2|nr:DUF2690 domain-containing protein [Actinoplanes maris]
MINIKKRSTVVMAGAVTALLGSALFAGPAAAAAGGCGSVCDGKNPQNYVYQGPGGPSQWVTCQADAYTKYTAGKSGHAGYVELRYSPACRTAWAKTNTLNTVIHVYSYNSNGSERRHEDQVTNSSVKYTVMVNDAGYTAKACATVPASGGDMLCTKKF